VELNAFTSPQLVEWIETKLREHLPDRLVPSDDVLSEAYQRALAVAEINEVIEEVAQRAISRARGAEVPAGLRQRLIEGLSDSDPVAWDRKLYDLVRSDRRGN